VPTCGYRSEHNVATKTTLTLEAAISLELWEDEAIDIDGYAGLVVKNFRDAYLSKNLKVGRELSRRWDLEARPGFATLFSENEVEEG
jgi:hypothetical protein